MDAVTYMAFSRDRAQEKALHSLHTLGERNEFKTVRNVCLLINQHYSSSLISQFISMWHTDSTLINIQFHTEKVSAYNIET